MKLLVVLTAMLLSFSVNATSYTVYMEWVVSQFREDNSPLNIEDIAYQSMYRVSCSTAQKDIQIGVNTQIINNNIYRNSGLMYWTSPTPEDCIVMTTTDTDGRTSKISKVFKAVTPSAPQQIACTL